MPELFHRLQRNVIVIFGGRNLLWHTLAIGLTMLIVMSGFDWSYYLSTRGDSIRALARPAIVLGGTLPIFGTLLLLMVGEVGRIRRIITTAWALGQAAILGYLISCGYKAFTGRIPPPFHGFRMSAMNAGTFRGHQPWFPIRLPQGRRLLGLAFISHHRDVCHDRLPHRALSQEQTTRSPRAALCALIGLGVSVTIHWFSEFAAGAIIGSVIGTVVGRSFAVPSAHQSPAKM